MSTSLPGGLFAARRRLFAHILHNCNEMTELRLNDTGFNKMLMKLRIGTMMGLGLNAVCNKQSMDTMKNGICFLFTFVFSLHHLFIG